MATPAQDLVVEPQQLVFVGPFSEPRTVSINLTNPEDKEVAYKIKCTNNAKFRIRPVIGKLAPGGNVAVQLTCQPFSEDPATVRKEKFVVYHVVNDKGADNAKAVWDGASAPPKTKDLAVQFATAPEATPVEPAGEPAPEILDQTLDPAALEEGGGAEAGA